MIRVLTSSDVYLCKLLLVTLKETFQSLDLESNNNLMMIIYLVDHPAQDTYVIGQCLNLYSDLCWQRMMSRCAILSGCCC